METVAVPKDVFEKILEDVEILIDDVESALDQKVRKKVHDIETGSITGKTEKDLDTYLKKRGVAIDGVDYPSSP